jgi:hypothetical protein
MNEPEARVLYVVHNWISEAQLEEWDRWHTEVHMPQVVAQPTVRRARKYRVMVDNTPGDWKAQYVTIYEFDSWADWEAYNTSPAAAALRQDHTDRFGAHGKIARQVLVQTAESA